MPTVRIPTKSRLQFVDLLSADGVTFWDIADLPSIPIQVDDIYYMLTDADRIDRLATTYYGDPVLWWVIAVANDMEIIPEDFVTGTQIRIPSLQYVQSTLFKRNR